jgi:chloramphenicol O-acetyltransferase type A
MDPIRIQTVNPAFLGGAPEPFDFRFACPITDFGMEQYRSNGSTDQRQLIVGVRRSIIGIKFYRNAIKDVEDAKKTREYGLDMMNHPNWFDASYISWLSYDSLNIELPDGYLHFAPIINWGKYREENGRLMMPVSVRLNHAIADGFLVANVYRLLEKEITAFCMGNEL